MSDLWKTRREAALKGVEPLAVRMRPRTLGEFVGQRHVLGEGKLLRRMVEGDVVGSLILFGPAGTGKTTLAGVIAAQTKRVFERENAASVGVARVREIMDGARRRLETDGVRTVLFLDEIHRFSRAQQDVLLGDVERGIVTLIGATTENPVFSVNSALVSRSTVVRLEALSEEDVKEVVRRALADGERGYGGRGIEVAEEALDVWAVKCEGDARRALTALEVAVESSRGDENGRMVISRETAEESIQGKLAVYDATGDEHYDAASALIKSIRGSDPDAGVYWLARMLDAGEDPRFIARRLAILASEDVGNADPRGLMVASAAWEVVERVGMPECRITLAQCVVYLALAPKSNASYVAVEEAMKDVREGRVVAVPVFLRDSHAPPAADGRAHGTGYVYTHDAGGGKGTGRPGTTQGACGDGSGGGGEADPNLPGVISGQDYLGVEKRYVRPGTRGFEATLSARLEAVLRARQEARARGA